MIPFRKMNGLGNDFVVIDLRGTAGAGDGARPAPDILARLADRDKGIGFDQFITLEDSDDADIFMRIDNADGGEVEACGNATRCIAGLLFRDGATAPLRIETRGGMLRAHSGTAPSEISIDMGVPKFGWEDIPLAEYFPDTRYIELQAGPADNPVLHSPSVVNVGNPHAIFWVDDVMAHRLDLFGPMLENHPLFPERANISLAHVPGPDRIILRTWERGVGLTKACGTAACAALACAARTGRTGRAVTVALPGGDLAMRWDDDDHIWMTGPWALDYGGHLDVATGEFTRDENAA
jgi:diaminopimelate epimerase